MDYICPKCGKKKSTCEPIKVDGFGWFTGAFCFNCNYLLAEIRHATTKEEAEDKLEKKLAELNALPVAELKVHEEWFDGEEKPRNVLYCTKCLFSYFTSRDAVNYCTNCGAKFEKKDKKQSEAGNQELERKDICALVEEKETGEERTK